MARAAIWRRVGRVRWVGGIGRRGATGGVVAGLAFSAGERAYAPANASGSAFGNRGTFRGTQGDTATGLATMFDRAKAVEVGAKHGPGGALVLFGFALRWRGLTDAGVRVIDSGLSTTIARALDSNSATSNNVASCSATALIRTRK